MPRLQRLLSRNRNIVVVNHWNQKHTNGSRIEKLYALNHVYSGSAILVKETTWLRSAILKAALTESYSTNFQFLALLLSAEKIRFQVNFQQQIRKARCFSSHFALLGNIMMILHLIYLQSNKQATPK